MPQQPRTQNFARIGRSYPRIVLTPEREVAESTLARYAGRFAVVAGVVVLVSGLALIGWLFAR